MNCIVTGASKGLGLATAKLLAQRGHNLAICSRNIVEIENAARELRTLYPVEIHACAADLSKKEDCDTFAAFCLKHFPEIDVLVNNAGVYLGGSVFDEEDGRLEKMMATNVYSVYNLSRAIVPSMIERKEGYIFNICSIASITAYPGGGSYSASKAALYGLTKVMRAELKDKGIKVTAVLPGATWSDSWAGVSLPQDRLMEANDIALLIANALELSSSAVIEEIIVRPQLGDL